MSKRRYEVTVQRTVVMVVDDEVIEQGLLPDNPIQGPGATEHDIVEHLGFNIVGNCLRLSQIDGYANLEDKLADTESWELWDVEYKRIDDAPPAPVKPTLTAKRAKRPARRVQPRAAGRKRR